jgi:hypothetical protein
MTDSKKTLRQVAAASLLLVLWVALAGSAFAQGRTVTVPAGTRILVRMNDTVDSNRSRAGSIFTATLQTNLVVGSQNVARAGTLVHGRLTEARSGGRAAGRSELALELTDIIINGTPFPLLTGEYSVQGSNNLGTTARRTGVGAGLGAAIGAIGGSAGRGAAIGSVVGGGASLATRGEQIHIPAETLLEFRLQQPATLPAP